MLEQMELLLLTIVGEVLFIGIIYKKDQTIIFMKEMDRFIILMVVHIQQN